MLRPIHPIKAPVAGLSFLPMTSRFERFPQNQRQKGGYPPIFTERSGTRLFLITF